jgi:hypothetical protein
MKPRQKAEGKRHNPEASFFVLTALLAVLAPGANAAETMVTFDVVTPDPNDPNYTAPLIEAEPAQQISYSITAIIYTDPNNQSCDPDVTKGLGAAYVTLSTDFADGNYVREANEICATLNPSGTLALTCLGLPFGDDVTDIGGSQDLLGDGSTAPNAFANGYKVVIATGTLTAPTADGVYHVWITPQQASALGPNLAQPPFGNPPDHVTPGPGFYVARGTYYTLTLTLNHESYGQVTVEPNLPGYAPGTEVTLTAIPVEGREFDHWELYDPNYPGDPYHMIASDPNNPLTIVMNSDHQVLATFKCDSGRDAMLPLGIVGIAGALWLIRRLRMHS